MFNYASLKGNNIFFIFLIYENNIKINSSLTKRKPLLFHRNNHLQN